MDFFRIIDWLRLGTAGATAALIASSLLLFTPDDILDDLALLKVRDDYGVWAGFTFLSGASVLGAQVAGWGFKTLRDAVRGWRQLRTLRGRLHSLSESERRILRGYIDEGSRTQYFELSDGVVRELERFQILWRPSELSQAFTSFAFNIQPWAWDHLQEHPELLEPPQQGRADQRQ